MRTTKREVRIVKMMADAILFTDNANKKLKSEANERNLEIDRLLKENERNKEVCRELSLRLDKLREENEYLKDKPKEPPRGAGMGE